MRIEDINIEDIYIYNANKSVNHIFTHDNSIHDISCKFYGIIRNDSRFINADRMFLNITKIENIVVYDFDDDGSYIVGQDINKTIHRTYIKLLNNDELCPYISNDDINLINAYIRTRKLNDLMEII